MSDFLTARQNMVDGQVRPSDVTEFRIIEAMLTVPREVFVPADKQALAYLDIDLDVGGADRDKRFLLQPAVLAKLLQAAEIKQDDTVLVAGCATGYSAAIAAKLAAKVTAVDPDQSLVAFAKAAFDRLGYTNVSVSVGPVSDGNAANGPYDVIVLDGATEIIPETLYRQLKDGGRLVGVFATAAVKRATIITRSGDDFGRRALFDASAMVLPGLRRTEEFVF